MGYSSWDEYYEDLYPARPIELQEVLMKRTNIIVWLDNEEEWNRVYLDVDGKLYIKIGAGKNDFALLNNCFVREIASLQEV